MRDHHGRLKISSQAPQDDSGHSKMGETSLCLCLAIAAMKRIALLSLEVVPRKAIT
jgi:hypothetical protein